MCVCMCGCVTVRDVNEGEGIRADSLRYSAIRRSINIALGANWEVSTAILTAAQLPSTAEDIADRSDVDIKI